jgi:hypothetical protein
MSHIKNVANWIAFWLFLIFLTQCSVARDLDDIVNELHRNADKTEEKMHWQTPPRCGDS